jgi:hypothetical protein
MSKYRHLNRKNGEECVNKSFENRYFQVSDFFGQFTSSILTKARNYSKLPDNPQNLSCIAAAE